MASSLSHCYFHSNSIHHSLPLNLISPLDCPHIKPSAWYFDIMKSSARPYHIYLGMYLRQTRLGRSIQKRSLLILIQTQIPLHNNLIPLILVHARVPHEAVHAAQESGRCKRHPKDVGEEPDQYKDREAGHCYGCMFLGNGDSFDLHAPLARGPNNPQPRKSQKSNPNNSTGADQ